MSAATLDPATWGSDTVAKLMQLRLHDFHAGPQRAHPEAVGEHGAVGGTNSPEATHAAIVALQHGGSVVDAALTGALQQVVSCYGSYVAFGGLMTMMHFDAASGEVSNLNAAYNLPKAESDPMSIRGKLDFADMFKFDPDGRASLIPGFFRGAEAAHQRFGRLPWADLFQPAIHFAERGLPVTEAMAEIFRLRRESLTNTAGGRATFTKADGSLYAGGEILKQTALANTLRRIAQRGADYFYAGEFAERLVTEVNAQGGCWSLSDLADYRAIWPEPLSLDYGDYRLFMHGQPADGGILLAEALNLVRAADLHRRADYRDDPRAFADLLKATQLGVMLTYLGTGPAQSLVPELAWSAESRVTPEHAALLWKAIKGERISLGKINSMMAAAAQPAKSAAISVVDADGNICTLLHTINTIHYGGTGVIVDGITVNDAAAHQQVLLARCPPGARLPDPTCPMVVTREGRGVLGSATIGSGLFERSLQCLHLVLHHGKTVGEADSWRQYLRHAFPTGAPDWRPTGHVLEGQFSADFLAAVEAAGEKVVEVDPAGETSFPLRGFWSAVQIDDRGRRRAVDGKFADAHAAAY